MGVQYRKILTPNSPPDEATRDPVGANGWRNRRLRRQLRDHARANDSRGKKTNMWRSRFVGADLPAFSPFLDFQGTKFSSNGSFDRYSFRTDKSHSYSTAELTMSLAFRSPPPFTAITMVKGAHRSFAVIGNERNLGLCYLHRGSECAESHSEAKEVCVP